MFATDWRSPKRRLRAEKCPSDSPHTRSTHSLEAEESRSYYGGIVLEPTGGFLKNFSFSVDWSNIYVYDRIQTPSVAVSMNQNDPAVVIRSPATAEDRALGQPGEVTELRLVFQNLVVCPASMARNNSS